jgi:hypothetical protein
LDKAGSTECQNNDGNFKQSTREYKDCKRKLSSDFFYQKKHNGEVIQREWLLYSPTTGCIFCFACRLFSQTKTLFSHSGFNDWRHAHRISEHECSSEHRQAVLTLLASSNNSERNHINSLLDKQVETEQKYWRDVLQRVVAVIKFLSTRGLPFRGDNERLGSVHNGNYLGTLELLSQFDPFFADHLAKHGNPGKGNTSYISSTICDEFVSLMGNTVVSEIVREIKTSKYFSFSVDSTPDQWRSV